MPETRTNLGSNTEIFGDAPVSEIETSVGEIVVEGVTRSAPFKTFRHTFGTLLNASGENPNVVQELLRHAPLKVTTDTYMQALSPDKRRAQANLVTMVRGRKATA